MLAFMQVWTIEVADAAPVASAGSWRRSHGERLVEASLTHGAKDWTWVVRPWGVLVELSFDDGADWLRFRATPAVQAALDAAPESMTAARQPLPIDEDDPLAALGSHTGGFSPMHHPMLPDPQPPDRLDQAPASFAGTATDTVIGGHSAPRHNYAKIKIKININVRLQDQP